MELFQIERGSKETARPSAMQQILLLERTYFEDRWRNGKGVYGLAGLTVS